MSDMSHITMLAVQAQQQATNVDSVGVKREEIVKALHQAGCTNIDAVMKRCDESIEALSEGYMESQLDGVPYEGEESIQNILLRDVLDGRDVNTVKGDKTLINTEFYPPIADFKEEVSSLQYDAIQGAIQGYMDRFLLEYKPAAKSISNAAKEQAAQVKAARENPDIPAKDKPVQSWADYCLDQGNKKRTSAADISDAVQKEMASFVDTLSANGYTYTQFEQDVSTFVEGELTRQKAVQFGYDDGEDKVVERAKHRNLAGEDGKKLRGSYDLGAKVKEVVEHNTNGADFTQEQTQAIDELARSISTRVKLAVQKDIPAPLAASTGG